MNIWYCSVGTSWNNNCPGTSSCASNTFIHSNIYAMSQREKKKFLSSLLCATLPNRKNNPWMWVLDSMLYWTHRSSWSHLQLEYWWVELTLGIFPLSPGPSLYFSHTVQCTVTWLLENRHNLDVFPGVWLQDRCTLYCVLIGWLMHSNWQLRVTFTHWADWESLSVWQTH